MRSLRSSFGRQVINIPKFAYKMQGFLDLREQLESQKKLEYGQAIAGLENEKTKLSLLKSEKDSLTSRLRDEIAVKIKPEDIQRANVYKEVLDLRIEGQRLAVKKAEDFTEEKRLELVKSMQDRKMLDVLKDKNYAEFIRESKILEQKQTDEVVSYRYGNRA